MPPAVRMFLPLSKIDAKQRMVYGIGALQVQDKTGETFHYETSKPFIQAWSDEASAATDGKSLGNIRAMHGKVAAGVVKNLNFNDDDCQVEIGSKIVDDDEWKKVEEGVYTGFSIGGDYVKRWTENNIKYYTAKPSEFSLVDNPAMPGANFTMIKADGMQETRSFATYAPEGNPSMRIKLADITNEMVVAKAMQMGKEAGLEKWADLIPSARTELEKSADDYIPTAEGNPGEPGVGMPRVTVVKPDAKGKITPASGVQNSADTTASGAMAETTQENSDSSVAKPSEPGNTASPDPRSEGGATLGKTNDPRNEVVQGWAAKDGTFHLTKAAALSHNETIKPASPAAALDAALQDLGKAVSDVKGDDATKKTPSFLQTDTDNKPGAKTEKAADGKPYGDVAYADPGYQADKKARYPIDDEKHIKAAWSYIHKKANCAKYTSAQCSSIKSKITAAWKSKIDKEGPPEVAEKLYKGFQVGILAKGMYNVARLATIIEDLDWLQGSLEGEAMYEKDDSPLPAQLKGDIASLVGTLKNLVDEETSEMFDEDEHIVLVDLLEMAATSTPGTILLKFIKAVEGSEKLSKAEGMKSPLELLKAKLPKEHAAKMQEIHDHSCSMGAKCDTGSMGKAAGNTLDTSKLEKGMEVLSQENADLRENLTKAVGVITSMAADIRAIKDAPAAVPATTLQVVGKNGDGGPLGNDTTAIDALSKMSPETLATAAIGLIHRTGGARLDQRPRNA